MSALAARRSSPLIPAAYGDSRTQTEIFEAHSARRTASCSSRRPQSVAAGHVVAARKEVRDASTDFAGQTRTNRSLTARSAAAYDVIEYGALSCGPRE